MRFPVVRVTCRMNWKLVWWCSMLIDLSRRKVRIRPSKRRQRFWKSVETAHAFTATRLSFSRWTGVASTNWRRPLDTSSRGSPFATRRSNSISIRFKLDKRPHSGVVGIRLPKAGFSRRFNGCWLPCKLTPKPHLNGNHRGSVAAIHSRCVRARS